MVQFHDWCDIANGSVGLIGEANMALDPARRRLLRAAERRRQEVVS